VRQGLGCRTDARKAAGWYRRAAAQGHAEAQYCLALALRHGRGLPADARAAERWYRKAAGQGHANAAWNLARLLLFGAAGGADEAGGAGEGWLEAMDVERLPEAWGLLRAAAAGGSEQARGMLAEIDAYLADAEGGADSEGGEEGGEEGDEAGEGEGEGPTFEELD
jgi:TPR repeat protein